MPSLKRYWQNQMENLLNLDLDVDQRDDVVRNWRVGHRWASWTTPGSWHINRNLPYYIPTKFRPVDSRLAELRWQMRFNVLSVRAEAPQEWP